MIKASYKDKHRIVDILSNSFNENKSVNYIIQQDAKRELRIRHLMDYSFEVCYRYGKVFLSDDKKACALIVLPDKKKTSIKSILLDLKLIISCLGLSNIKKAIAREEKIKSLQPKEPMYYLWFIGVETNYQGQGIGSSLLEEIIAEAKSNKRSVCLETSTQKNIPWYLQHGFSLYNELNLGYDLFFLKK